MSYSGHIKYAKSELRRGYLLSEHDDVDGAVQHACLATEHALKAVLADEEKTVPTGSRGHNLNFLASEASMNIPYESLLIKLDGSYNQARYPDTPPHGITDPDTILNSVEGLITYIAESRGTHE